MDECIAQSISQRTAFMLRTLEHRQPRLDGYLGRQPDYGTFSTLMGRTFTESKSEGDTRGPQTQPTSSRSTRATGRPAPMVKAMKSQGRPASNATTSKTTTLKSKSLNKFSEADSNFYHPSNQQGSRLAAPPPSEGRGRGLDGNGGTAFLTQVPRYDTYYTPKSYQPLATFNLCPQDARMTCGKGFDNPQTTRGFGLGTSTASATRGMSLSNGLEERTNYRDVTPRYRGGSFGNSITSSAATSFKHDQSTKNSCSAYNFGGHGSETYTFKSNYYPQSGTTQSTTQKTSTETKEKVSLNANKNKIQLGKSTSLVPHQGRGQAGPQGSAGRCQRGSGNPDLNNNFYKGGPNIFFGNRIPYNCCDEELSGDARINRLAQPKRYPCTHMRCYGGKKLTPEAMRRLEVLAQPKLCHYTVCSCCLSPNCLGECVTKVRISRSNCHDPSCVDWARLATPRKSIPPSFKPIKAVNSAALKASSNKRIEKLSVPRKVINSGDYYLWLWKKRPDTIQYLKPIRRLSVAKCELKDTRVLLRCDLDFTQGKPIDCKVRDALPTMQLALKKGAKSIVIISRCGPEGIPKDPAYSLKPLAQVFEEYLETPVIFLDDCVGFQAQALCEDPVPGSVFLLENLSFAPEEVGYYNNGPEKVICTKEEVNKYQKIISDHGDIYITDSFNELVHMTNTTVGYPPKDFGYGFNIKRELSIFHKFALKPPVPVMAIVAGPFERTWTAVRNLMGQVTDILIGGQMAWVFMKAIKGIELGNTECTEKMEKKALKMFSRAKDTGTILHLPSDVVVQNIKTEEYFVALTREDIDEDYRIVDIGPHTRRCYIESIREAAAILWMGDFGSLSDGTEIIKTAYLEAARAGTPTYAADDHIKKHIGVISKPEECLFVTGDGEATENLLCGHIPKGISVLSKSRRKVKRGPIPEDKSLKPNSYELPGMAIPGGTKTGISYGASHTLLCINHVPVENMRVIIRVEFNEPMADNTVTNNYRMRMTIPTIKYCLKWRARVVVILAHFRDPQGRRDSELSLKPICDEMASLLGETVIFVPRTVGKDVMTTINVVHPGSILMLENLRFNPEEEQGFMTLPDGRLRPLENVSNPSRILPGGYQAEMNAQFCEELSRLGDIYVNDAFGALHLDHASITGNLRPTRVCGFLVKNELKYLSKLLNYPSRKFLVILGGVDLEDKLDLMPGIFKEADSLLLAGTLACLFLKVEHGLKTGTIVFTEKLLERAKEMIRLAVYYKCRIHYPVDLACCQGPVGETLKQVSISEGIPDGYTFVDIGKLSASMFTRIIKRMHMIFWIGTTGNGQLEYTRSSTKLLMEALSSVTHDPEKSAMTIVGGRGLSQIVEKYDPDHEAFTHLTTGGRTALELLARRQLIGLDPLLPKPGKRPLSLMGASDYTEFREANVLVVCDLDLPMIEDESVDTFPLHHLAETVKYILKKGVKAILLVSHRGDPDGHEVETLSLEPVKPILEALLDQEVIWAPNALVPDADNPMLGVPKGSVLLAENIGFHSAESGYMVTETGDRIPVCHEDMDKFRGRLNSLADILVNESFSTIHRAYSSVVGISKKPCIAGLTLKKQIYDYVDLRRQLDGTLLLILGTDELDDIFPKLLLLYSVLDIVQHVFLCGNMAAVFKSSAASSSVKQFKDAQLVIPRIVRKARLNKVTLDQVTDSYAARDPSNPEEEPRVVHLDSSLPRGHTRCDMGPASINALTNAIRGARLIVLCGTTGPVQYDHHQRGTKGILDQIATATNSVNADGFVTAIALGMRTGQFVHQLGHVETFSNISVDPEPFFDILVRRPLAGLQVIDRLPVNLLKKLSIEQMNLAGKRVLMRLDLDVPSVEGVVLDTDKLEDAAPSVMYALSQGAKCVVMLGHRGEPVGYKNYYLRMEPLIVEVSAILGVDVQFIDRPCSKKAKKMLEDPPHGSVFLMENLKFYPAEMGQDAEPRRPKHLRRTGDASLSEVSEISKDKDADESAPPISDEMTASEPAPDEDEEEDESISDEALSVSDGEGGRSVDSLMYQLMRPKTVEQFIRDIAACGDVYVNDDVAHVEEPLTSYAGFGLSERGCGLLLAEFLKDSEEASVYQLPGVDGLSPA